VTYLIKLDRSQAVNVHKLLTIRYLCPVHSPKKYSKLFIGIRDYLNQFPKCVTVSDRTSDCRMMNTSSEAMVAALPAPICSIKRVLLSLGSNLFLTSIKSAIQALHANLMKRIGASI